MIAMGTVMEIETKKALVFTMDGSVIYVKPRMGLFVGQQIAFTKKEVVTGKKRVLSVLPFAAMAAALLVVACIATGVFRLAGAFQPLGGSPCTAYIALDINPSIQFKIDEAGAVISVSALNDDGRTLLGKLRLEGEPVERAVQEAIAQAKALGFIKDAGSVVLVAGALNDGNSAVTVKRSEYRSKLEGILGSLGNNNDADVLALYIDDSSVKKNADNNGLSLGRELLKEFAAQNHIDLTDSDVRSGKISDLINRISDPEKCLPVVTPEPEDTPKGTEEATATPTDKPTDKPTAEPTKESSAAPTDTPEATPTPAPTDKPETSVAARAYGTGIKVSWSKAPDTGSKFLYYKIVLSTKDSTPRYPDNGYAKVISNIDELSAVIKPGCGYNGGDLGGCVKAGVTYYVSVTYVYESDALYGNAVRVKCPEEPEPTNPPDTGFDGAVSAYVDGDHIHISWDKAPSDDGFCYYKVVFSKTDSTPKYPDNGYLYCISNIDETSCNAAPGQDYCNGGECIGRLEAGETYYISVTYVYNDSKKYGSVKRVTMPGTPEPTATPVTFTSPTTSVSVQDGKVVITWKRIPEPNVTYNGKTYTGFQYYKVVKSTSPNPRYPEDGYIQCESNRGTTTFRDDLGNYEAGQTYYFSVTYVFGGENKYIYADDATLTIPASTPAPTPSPAPAPVEFAGGSTNAAIDGDHISINWTRMPESSVTYEGESYLCFKYYKVVYSESPNPKYPDDPYIAAISNRSACSISVSLPNEHLLSGKTYYFSVTYVFDGGKYIYAGDSSVTIP